MQNKNWLPNKDFQLPPIFLPQASSKWKLFFFIVAVIVQVSLLIKCSLFIFRLVSARVFLLQACPETNSSSTSQQYIFTMVIYSSLFLGRWAEALILHIHIYKFFFSQNTLDIDEFRELCSKGLKQKAIKALFIFMALCLLIFSLSIPVLGIILEFQHGCGAHTVYWIFDIVRYVHDVAVRIIMLLATIVIGQIWSPELQTVQIENDSNEPTDYTEYLADRNIVCEDHQIRTMDYTDRGCKVERILEIFQTWFIIPWLLYFVGSSLDIDHILRSWKDGSNSDGRYDFPEIAYMVYNFNQIFFLMFAFLCSKKMNTDHCEYFSWSRYQQLNKFKTASKMAFASLNKIEKEDHFDFVPRIWGSSIKIPINNSIYIVVLFVGVFFTVIEGLN